MATQVTGDTSAPTLAPEASLATELAGLNAKLDVLGEQVGHLYQRTLALEELKGELIPILRDATGALGAELSAVEQEFNSEEIAQLLRKLLRNTPTFIRMLDRLEALDGFVAEIEPLGKDVVRELIDRLQVMEERGYFRLLRGGLELVDRISSHATQEDVDRLAHNVVSMVDTVKRMTQPEMLARTNDAIAALDKARSSDSRPLGLWDLVRASRDPEVREGLGVLMEVTRQLGRRNGEAAPHEPTPAKPSKEE